MWRLRSVVILGVLAGMLVFGAAVAYGSWWWNAQVDVEGVKIRTIWTVLDDETGEQDYGAKIIIYKPEDAKARLLSKEPNERVRIKDKETLDCLAEGIELKVKSRVFPLTADAAGTVAKLTVKTVGKHAQVLGEATGPLDEFMKVKVVVPGATCSDD